MADFARRRRPAHHPLVERRNRSRIVLLTICADKRRPLFIRPDVVSMIQRAWLSADSWLVGRWVAMPDHLHLFCTPASHDSPPLASWVKYWKSLVSREWPYPDEQPIWQQNFWDTQLRDSEHYSAKWDYVRNNPVRRGLVADAANWPWQGEQTVFRFHNHS